MKKIEIYIHIPFCVKKCNYCDFVSFFAKSDIIEKYTNNLLSEIKIKNVYAINCEISSIYIGGGTPSFIDSKYICIILNHIYKYYHISKECEISIEINPNTADIFKFKDYYNSGINRISFGLQSCNDNELKILGRLHNYSDFVKALESAKLTGFNNINVDLINGIPKQTAKSYKTSLLNVLKQNIQHISIYNLIIEPNTVFYKLYSNNELNLPLEDEILQMDKITYELTALYDFKRYEISNYSKKGFECQHNLGYWSDIPYLGFGLNSSTYYNNTRFKNKTKLNEYLELDYNNYHNDIIKYYDEMNTLTKEEHISEYIMLNMRKTIGININEFNKIFNLSFENNYKYLIDKYVKSGHLQKIENNYCFTDIGFDISNTILSEFI